MITRSLLRSTLMLSCLLAATARAADPTPMNPEVVRQDLKAFAQYATVLHVAAHPDDENTNLITYLARGRGYRTAYLSITRGDGGQNLLGPEFDEELGLIRTHELLAARELDKGRQFFTRAIDFGFSKSWDETLRFWDRKQVLGDVVRVIRTFRPDVVIARFNPDVPGTNGGTHGHHTASAILAREAFPLAGDPKAYPEQLIENGGNLTVWQPKRLLLNAGFGGGGGATLRIETGGTDPVLSQPYTAIAAQSRAMHKSQGFGNFGGAGGGGGARGGRGAGGGGAGPSESFTLLAGDPATTDIMDGIDTTWARVGGGSGGADIAKLTAEALDKFNTTDLAANVPALLAIKARLAGLPKGTQSDPIIAEKTSQLDRLLASCLGLGVETTVASADVFPGQTLTLNHKVTTRTATGIRWLGVRYPSLRPEIVPPATPLSVTEPAIAATHETLPANTPVSQPYWLREPSAAGIARVDTPTLIGRPTNPPVLPVEFLFELTGPGGPQTIILQDEPVQLMQGAPAPQARRPLAVIPPVSLAYPFDVRLFTPGASRTVDVEVTAARANTGGTLALDGEAMAAGWKVSPASLPFFLANVGDKAKLTFTVTAPAKPASSDLVAKATVGGNTYSTDRKEILYPHLPRLLLQPTARLKAVALDMVTKGKTVGYIPGAGDSVAGCIEQMGYTVKPLDPKAITPETLKGLDAVVVGVRAYDTKAAELAAANPALTAYVASGGTLIAQYNRNGSPQIGPFSVRVANVRTTDETAPPTFLAPDHPALTTPNKITPADFEGWVQERGIYYPQSFDPAFTPLLAFSDPQEQPQSGSLLVANHGKGHVVYTSLVFFRELPAGVPGAYRLFVNLVSLGKP